MRALCGLVFVVLCAGAAPLAAAQSEDYCAGVNNPRENLTVATNESLRDGSDGRNELVEDVEKGVVSTVISYLAEKATESRGVGLLIGILLAAEPAC